jgi:uncharacterized protein (DUF1330 family)
MKAYLIVTLTVHDEAMFAEYRKQVGDTAKPFGGSFSPLVVRRLCSKVSGSILAS